ncbi:MAG TPA: CehA/McbA family metallohydrolase [Verrucomicrobiae bacterium]|nr:CehA/McbA family metallohydrolase [Verrucomicrobiae bacterium]
MPCRARIHATAVAAPTRATAFAATARASAFATATLLLLTPVSPARASVAQVTPPSGRETVLKQIKVPHNYYYREMYLPQVTSGPSGADWSPDGRRLVLSMRGSLFIHDLEKHETRQVTDGPGYDYQPDWSADGRFIVYASYRDDAVDLYVHEVATGASRPLVRNGAVNVEPRFSPDGKKVAYVSTEYEGRFHVFTVDVPDTSGETKAARPERVTDDRDSGLPRYYYSVYDHSLSPAWSPDGDELLVVSNRGKIWGTGGFWRIRSRPGGKAKAVHDEETTWRARPDWSPDGRRIVYASYAGRQWHQLWLMTADGGDPLQLTYGDFDMTSPRWSADGRRIVAISNEPRADRGAGGRFSDAGTRLVVVDVPGGAHELDLGKVVPFGPRGRLQVSMADGAGRPIPARVSVMGEDGRFFAPDDAWRHADEAFVRGESRFEYGYFHARGSATLSLAPGTYRVEVSRGPEFKVHRSDVTIQAGATLQHRATLERLKDMPAAGWRSADLHVHMNYCGNYRNDPKHLAFQADAEGLNLIEDLIVNKEQRFPDISYFSPLPDPASTPNVLIVHGQEFHTSYWGHTALLGLDDHLILPGYSAYANTPAASPYPHNAAVFDLAHQQKALTGYVHPFDTRPDPYKMDEPLAYEMPADAVLGKMDYFEVMGFSDHLITSEIWYRLLNLGLRIPAGAGTDAMANYASLRGPVGLVRVFVQTGPRFDHPTFLAGLKAGKTFVSNAPLLDLGVRSDRSGAFRGPGSEFRLAAGRRNLEARVDVRSPVPLDHVELVANGQVVGTVPLAADRMSARGSVTVPFETSGWLLLRAWADKPAWPVLDLYPFASTSPVYVRIGEQDPRSPDDAAYFVQWMDRVIASAKARKEWNTEDERADVMATLDAARQKFIALGGD